jgi:large conductance mechanosensitive channel
MGFIQDFKAFAMRGNVIDLAVGVIIGGAFGAIVSSLVNDMVMPVLSLVTGRIDFKERFIALDGNSYANMAAAKAAKAATLNYGSFLNAVINFLLIAFVVFVMVRLLMKLLPQPAPPPPPGPTPTEKLLTEIRDELRGGPPRLNELGVAPPKV